MAFGDVSEEGDEMIADEISMTQVTAGGGGGRGSGSGDDSRLREIALSEAIRSTNAAIGDDELVKRAERLLAFLKGKRGGG